MKINKKSESLYKYYIDYRKTLEKYILLNSSFYQITFLFLIFVLYIFGFKTDIFSMLLIIIISIIILDGLRLKIKTEKLFNNWDNDYKNKTGIFKLKNKNLKPPLNSPNTGKVDKSYKSN